MGNLCSSGVGDRVGGKKKDKPATASKTDEQSITEAPLKTEKPATTEAPDTKEAPVTTETPATTEIPATTETPATSETPETTETLVKPARKKHGNVIVVKNAKSWEDKLSEAKASGKVIVVDFYATWCGPCRTMSPIFAKLSQEYTNMVFLRIDVDKVQDVTAKYEVHAMPTFLFIKNGEPVERLVGANDELGKKCKHYSTTDVSA